MPNPEDLGVIARFSVASTVVIIAFWIVMAWVSWRPAHGGRLFLGRRRRVRRVLAVSGNLAE